MGMLSLINANKPAAAVKSVDSNADLCKLQFALVTAEGTETREICATIRWFAQQLRDGKRVTYADGLKYYYSL